MNTYLRFKLKRNGIDGSLLTLISNYLVNRKQRVIINGSSCKFLLVYGHCAMCKRVFILCFVGWGRNPTISLTWSYYKFMLCSWNC